MKPLDPTLLGIFETEQREIVERLRVLTDPAGPPAAGSALEEALRRAHTLKGAARAVGLEATERLAHHMESLFVRVREGTLAADAGLSAALRRGLDAVDDVLAAVLAGGEEPDVTATVAALERAAGPESSAPVIAPHETAQPAGPIQEVPEPEAPEPEAPAPPAGWVRVNAANVDQLVRSAAQMLAAVSRQSVVTRGLDEVSSRLQEMGREWARLRQQAATAVRQQGPDSELAPLIEALDVLDRQWRSAAGASQSVAATHRSETRTLQQLASGLHHDASGVRMTPAETVFAGFRKMVRDLAEEEGKEVEFRIEGLEVQADRLVLQRLKDPVMHLLRNAISHGIEPPGERVKAGKPRTGNILLRIEARGVRLRVTVEDDGRGIDMVKVSDAAGRSGLTSSRDVLNVLFQPGFSTAESVTRLAGRGMGLSVVQQEVTRLHGRVDLGPGPGTSIILETPLTISVEHILLVACGAHTFGIPTEAVSRLSRVRQADIHTVDGSAAIRIGALPVFLARLEELLGFPGGQNGTHPQAQEPDGTPVLPVVVLRSDSQFAGVIVDRLVDEREAVVLDLGLTDSETGLAAGGVALEDGSVAVVLNPAAVFERWRAASKALPPAPEPAESRREPATILVVDDSITTRSLEKNILEAHGYRVRVAVDGLEALESLHGAPVDLVIADVSMPRMDGFELLENIKKDPQLARIPVMIVSSNERREDQERGLSLGADAYIVKRKFDQRELLALVRQIV